MPRTTPSADRQVNLHPFVSDERFRLLVDAVSDYAIFLLDTEGHVTTWNAGAQRIKGYTADEIIGSPFSRFYPDDAVRRGWPAYELQQAQKHGRFEDEGWRVRKDGSRFWANVVITALRDKDGVLVGFAKVTRDLTERKATEEALRRSEERFRLVVEAVTDYAIYMLDPNGYIVTWNAGAQRIHGYDAPEITGQHFSRFYPADALQSGWPEHELQVATEQGRFEDEGWRIRKDRSRFWANVIINALRDPVGNLLGFVTVTRDLSERKRAETLVQDGASRDEMLEAERSARIQAQRAARMKDEFLAMLSHELRTPLNSILGWAQILRRLQTKMPEVERGMEAIERSARMQVQLIDELLDLSRIMSGKMRLDVQRLMPLTVVQEAIETTEPAAQAKGIRLEKILDPVAGPISGDPARLQQVLWNLLSNAIKFTPKGGRVQVILERVNSHIELSVSDTGIGITPDFLPHVFERFSQKDSSTTRSYGGLGLGLAISKQLVELHGGTIRANSAGEGRGATFIVSLPLNIAWADEHSVDVSHPTHAASDSGQVLLPSLEGIRALIVDDETDTRDLMTQLLEQQGATVVAVPSGEAAIRLLESGHYDVLVSDIGMPKMDGYQLIRRIRGSGASYARIPALALTAFARGEDRKKALLAGYQSHLSKPFDIAELVLLVAGVVGRWAPIPTGGTGQGRFT